MPTVTPFETYCRRKEELAVAASLSGFRSITDASDGNALVPIGNDWSRRLFDGDFYRSAGSARPLDQSSGRPELRRRARNPAYVGAKSDDRPVVSLVFVQSRSGNTVAVDPSSLGGGETDKHLVYEGLSRVDADAVLAGAATARSERMVFSIWHPELVALRLSLGHDRHPAQIVITDRGDLPFDRGLMFAEPTLRVFVVTRSAMADALADRVRDRPWVEIIDAGDPLSPTAAMRQLRARSIRVISAVGGRRTATALLREGLVSDLYLTTSPVEAGEPNTPFYEGPPLALARVVEKAGQGKEKGVRFEHFLVRGAPV